MKLCIITLTQPKMDERQIFKKMQYGMHCDTNLLKLLRESSPSSVAGLFMQCLHLNKWKWHTVGLFL